MSLFGSVANYGGRQPDNFQNTKQFIESVAGQVTWIYKRLPNGMKVQTPSNGIVPVYINSDLYINGSIYNPSDRTLKDKIEQIAENRNSNFDNLEPKEFVYKADPSKKHFGFIAQDMEKIYPELVKDSEFGYKTINYVEIIPLLVSKIQSMQKEIDDLKEKCATRS
jgi:hypothetical protein